MTVPGAPATWRDLHARFGRLPFGTLFEPALYYAEQGFPVAPVTAESWAGAAGVRRAEERAGPAFRGWFETFTREGARGAGGPARERCGASRITPAPCAGSPRARGGSFYEGDLGAQIVRLRPRRRGAP